MEDYKKKYEQALDNFNKIKAANKDNKELVDFIEYEYPELKESRDERIRKECISIIDAWDKACRLQGDYCEVAPECIAWLRKQSEKVDAIENFDTEFEKHVSYLIASTINKEHEYNEGFVKWAANALLNYAKQELEKQGEQKQVPITDEWIEDYWKHHKVTNPNSYDKGDEVQFDHDGFVRFCNKYFQKPAWSEEDEDNYITALWHIKHSCGREGSLYNWLKSLKERYTWKPSDYQLEALDSATENCAYSEYQDCLRKLIVDLKKLKRE